MSITPFAISTDEQESIRCGARVLMRLADEIDALARADCPIREELRAAGLVCAQQIRARAASLYRLAERAGFDIPTGPLPPPTTPPPSLRRRRAGAGTSPAATVAGAF